MSVVKLTSKRQTTLPRELCRELRLEPGDMLNVEKRVVDGVAMWCLIRPRKTGLACFGIARKAAQGKAHDLNAIRKSIARGWAKEARP